MSEVHYLAIDTGDTLCGLYGHSADVNWAYLYRSLENLELEGVLCSSCSVLHMLKPRNTLCCPTKLYERIQQIQQTRAYIQECSHPPVE